MNEGEDSFNWRKEERRKGNTEKEERMNEGEDDCKCITLSAVPSSLIV